MKNITIKDWILSGFILITGVVIGALLFKGCAKVTANKGFDSSVIIKQVIIKTDSSYKVKLDSSIKISKEKDSIIMGLKSTLNQAKNKASVLKALLLADSTLSPRSFIVASDQRDVDCDSLNADLTAENERKDSVISQAAQEQQDMSDKMLAYFRTTGNNTIDLNRQIAGLNNEVKQKKLINGVIKWGIPVAFIAGLLIKK